MEGGGVCACLRRRKSYGESDVLSWLMLNCNLIFMMRGGLPDVDTNYLMGGAYHLLTYLTLRELSVHFDLVWNKFVPLKVSTFAS
ncbi:hypothetical protein TSUD_331460 [Trifolium subterraneum]|uniref:Uncharacterized protein n=1 Tax=Trifolium subterraneum TaxID=3900 RepID=A0A2Z6LYQ8_TRISU|nr:hypothetical protein TSUD_331460 [Trifolium subterraneum]